MPIPGHEHLFGVGDWLAARANGRAMKFTATNHASSRSGRCSFPQLRDMPVTLDARGTRMTLTGPACVSRLAKLMIGISLPTFDLGFKTWLRA